MNLPNKITLFRVFLVFLFMAFLFMRGIAWKSAALVTFIAAAFTDYLDGYLAKKYNMMSDFGKFMDPVADKILTLAAFLAFVEMKLIPAWMVVIIVTREMAITGLRIARALKRNGVLQADRGGKNKTISQMFSILVILIFIVLREAGSGMLPFWTPEVENWMRHVIYGLMLVTVTLTITSGISYVATNKKYFFGEKTA